MKKKRNQLSKKRNSKRNSRKKGHNTKRRTRITRRRSRKNMRGGLELTEDIITNLSLRKDLNWPTEKEIKQIWQEKQRDMPLVIKYFRENNNQIILSRIDKSNLKVAYSVDGVLHNYIDNTISIMDNPSRHFKPYAALGAKMEDHTLDMNGYIKDEMLKLVPSNIYIIDNNYDEKILKSWLNYNGINIPLENIHINYRGIPKIGRSGEEIRKNTDFIIRVLKGNSINEYTGLDQYNIKAIMMEKKTGKLDDLISLRFSVFSNHDMFFYLDLNDITLNKLDIFSLNTDPQLLDIFRKYFNYGKYFSLKDSENDKDKNYEKIKMSHYFTYSCNGYLGFSELEGYLASIKKTNTGEKDDSFTEMKPILNFNGAPGRTIIIPENYKLYRAISKELVKLYGDIKYIRSGGLYLTNKEGGDGFVKNPPGGLKGTWSLIDFTTTGRLELINLLDSSNLEWLIKLILAKYHQKAHILLQIIFNCFIAENTSKPYTPVEPKIDPRIPYFTYCSSRFANNNSILRDIYSLPAPDGFSKDFDIKTGEVNYLDTGGNSYTEDQLVLLLKQGENDEMKKLFEINEIIRYIIFSLNMYNNTDKQNAPELESFKSKLKSRSRQISDPKILDKVDRIIDSLNVELIYPSMKELEFIIFEDLKTGESFLRKNERYMGKYYDVEAWMKYKIVKRTTASDKNSDKLIYLLFIEIAELSPFKGYYHVLEPCNTPPSASEIMVLAKYLDLLKTEYTVPNLLGSEPESEALQVEKSRLSPLPSGWAQLVTEDGKPYYANHNTKETQWERPDPIPTPKLPDSAIFTVAIQWAGEEMSRSARLNLTHGMTIRDLKNELIKRNKLSKDDSKKDRLIYAGKLLEDTQLVEEVFDFDDFDDFDDDGIYVKLDDKG